MLARYSIVRGRPVRELPGEVRNGRRMDTRKHTRHVARPEPEMVREYLSAPTDANWARFEKAYWKLLERRFARDRAPFDEIAEAAREGDVFLGCNCPTAKNPDVGRCHTVLALRFFAETYPDLEVVFPGRIGGN